MTSITGTSSYLPTQGSKDASARSTASDADSAVELKKPDAREEFLNWSKKSWAEKMREQILKSLGYTEEELAALPPEERLKIEQKIADILKEKLKQETEDKGNILNMTV